MPTTRPRHQVTETPSVEHALDVAARRWPHEPRSRLLVRLVQAGGASLEREQAVEAGRQRDAINATSGKYGDVFDGDYLSRLREDWPA